MGLFAKFVDQSTDPPGKIHDLGAAIHLVAGGGISSAQAKTNLGLTGDEITEWDALVATYQATGSGNTKIAEQNRYANMVEAGFLAAKSGYITTEAQLKTLLGF